KGIPAHPCNNDEALYPNKIGSYTKGLPHNPGTYEVDLAAYNAMITALTTGHPADFEAIPLGGSRKLVNPQSGLAFDTEGCDPHQFAIPPAPAFASAEEAAEATELYWMALLRDVNFNDYATNPIAASAATELNALPSFTGPRIGGQVNAQSLFRDNLPGALTGPYLSQFMLKPTPFGAEYIVRRIRTFNPNTDRMVTLPNWYQVQIGNVPESLSFDGVRRFIRNGRDLSAWVQRDVLFQAYFDACLILGTPPDPTDPITGGGIGAPLNPGNPYRNSLTQEGFGTFGAPFIKTVLCEVSTRALKAVWFQKWFVHRRLRPEAYGGRVHLHKAGIRTYPLNTQVLNSQAVARTFTKFGTYLLPQAFPEGSPTHPAYGAGHATVAGACVTILKAMFDGSFVIPTPVVTDTTGSNLVPYGGGPLTVTGELNKLASNIATGRNHAGVHWRTDATASLRLGEQVAIELLRSMKPTFNEGGSFNFQKFDGTNVVI
ncbi:MAG TPA: vanadium-dependent haloperoxidase, partial [Thermoanaerobaculia bacterium]|nr:vanadium-dependent haloperoxidase [Thermoanaerobaculia bacterium]